MSTTKAKPALYALTPEAHATVLAALRHYQEAFATFGEPPAHVYALASDCGNVEPLTDSDIDKLSDDLNHNGLDFSAIVPLFAESSEDSAYVRTARENQKEGDFEVDDPAVVSRSDEGAYVMGWMWVGDDAAGLNTYWTIRLDASIPDGAKVVGGGEVPPEPVWYFADENEQLDAVAHAAQLGLTYEIGNVTEVPEDDDVSTVDDFKQWADERAAERDPV